MAHEDVETAIETYLKANWTRCDVFDVNVEENQLPTGSTAKFLQIQFPLADARRWALGDRYYREEGAFRIVISASRGIGTDLFKQWGKEIRALFIDRKIGGVNCRVPSPWLIDPRDAGPYAMSYSAMPYDYNWREA